VSRKREMRILGPKREEVSRSRCRACTKNGKDEECIQNFSLKT
jgi:hypothetical protein